MRIKYDFHIHTALSPCGDNSMTPNNIVNMALINELDVIAITDHNSCENIEAVMEVAKDVGILVIPGMEIETREEIHVVCLFPNLEQALKMQKIVYEKLPNIKNNNKYFGEQILFNYEDEIIGRVDRLLIGATKLSINDLFELVKIHKGAFIPAHIDRPSYSIISNLGMIPANMELSSLEVSRHVNYEDYKMKYLNYLILQSSDAHDLGYIGICNSEIDVNEKSIKSILDKINADPFVNK